MHITTPSQPLPKLASKIINLSATLFPHWKQHFADEPLTKPLQQLIHLLETIEVERYFPYLRRVGAPLADRQALMCAFIAKCVLKLDTTRQLIDRLRVDTGLRRICGYSKLSNIPSESTFSRFFAELAESELPRIIHDDLIRENLGDRIIGNISRDATEIKAREKLNAEAMKKLREEKQKKLDKKKQPMKRGRPKKGEVRDLPPETKIQKQMGQDLQTMMDELPKVCDRGAKCNAQGYKNAWNGYKLHLDTNDCGVVISAILTSASVHDSQVSIPLSKMSAGKVTSLYDVMDAGYCSEDLREHSRSMGHVPLIDHNARRGEKREFAPHEKEHYKIRTGAERANARMKDEFGAGKIYVRGHAKIYAHLMIGVLVLSADQLLRLLT